MRRRQADKFCQITLDDVAAAAGVTKTIVSQVLRDVPYARCRPSTRKRILAKAKKLNYRPNFFASQIRGERRKVVMLGVATLDDPFSGAVSAAFEHEVSSQGYSLIMGAMQGKKNSEFVESVVGKHGVLLVAVVGYASMEILPDEMLVDLAERGVHVVTIARPAPSPVVSEITYDNEAAIGGLLDAVVRPGMDRIWLLGTTTPRAPWDVGAIRNGAALRHLVGMGLGEKVTLVESGPPEINIWEGFRTVERGLALHSRPDLVVCTSDHLALGCIHALEDAGLEVGRDVAVTGFNDQPMSAFMRPQLTTVYVPMAEMGTQAARLIMDLNEGRRKDPVSMILETEVKLRESHMRMESMNHNVSIRR